VTTFIAYTVFGIVIGGAYAIAASGLVLTYTTSRVFNLAHGAIGMIMAFLFWELSVNRGLPTWLAFVLVVLVIAPLSGAIIERVMMRRLAEAPVSVSIVVTVGLLVGLIGAAQAIWPPAPRSVNGFFAPHGVHFAGTFVSWNQLITIILAAVVAGLLYLLLNRTRVGIAMRAVVDNADLLALHGARPNLLSSISWAGGASLAALAGILLAPSIGLDYYQLTLLVLSAFAAAVLGRLQNLPLTFVGALILGLAQSYVVGYVPLNGALQGLNPAIPVIFLFLIVLLLPQAQLRVGQIKGIVSVGVPSMPRAAGSAVLLLGVIYAVSLWLSDVATSDLALGLVYALLMLSVVLLTGYGGFVSLAPFTFAGIGAATVAKLATGSPLAIVAGALLAAAVGAIVALPVIRLRGLYLALATLAFAVLMDKLVFQANFAFGYGGTLPVKRMSLFGLTLSSERSYLFLVAVVFAAVGVGLLGLRRGRYGRLLIAMRDSPAACGTLGLNLVWSRVLLFALSAGMAGLAGGLFGGLRQSVGPNDFQLFASLPLLLLAIVGGATSVTGALIGGLLLMLLPILQSEVPALGGLVFLLIGAAAVSLGRNPNGVASYLFAAGRWVLGLLPKIGSRPPLTGSPAREGYSAVSEEVAVGGTT
jgi:branched-chain amino acid transport system permease protein